MKTILLATLLACAAVGALAAPANATGQYLFVVDAGGGAKIDANADGSYLLSLYNVKPRTLAFTDKPLRDVELVNTAEQLVKLVADANDGKNETANPNFVLVFGHGQNEAAIALTLTGALSLALHADGKKDDMQLNATVIDANKAVIEWGPRVGTRVTGSKHILPAYGQPALDATSAPAFLFVDDGDVVSDAEVRCRFTVALDPSLLNSGYKISKAYGIDGGDNVFTDGYDGASVGLTVTSPGAHDARVYIAGHNVDPYATLQVSMNTDGTVSAFVEQAYPGVSVPFTTTNGCGTGGVTVTSISYSNAANDAGAIANDAAIDPITPWVDNTDANDNADTNANADGGGAPTYFPACLIDVAPVSGVVAYKFGNADCGTTGSIGFNAKPGSGFTYKLETASPVTAPLNCQVPVSAVALDNDDNVLATGTLTVTESADGSVAATFAAGDRFAVASPPKGMCGVRTESMGPLATVHVGIIFAG